MKILILGGYGVFGGRLAQLLSDITDIELLICGRNLSSAVAYCGAYKGVARVRPLCLDRRDVAAALDAEAPDLVVDASGPFQDYGPDGYGVIAACIAARIDYLDFADAADFVFGVTRFDAQARAAGVFVLSGVSSFPVLTAAVLRDMAKTMEIVAVEGGIAPSPFAGIGLNVMRAVIGYAGAPVKLMRGGRTSHAAGLAESIRFTIAVPGRLPLRNTRFSLVDVPDLQVIPPQYPTLTDIWMGAASARNPPPHAQPAGESARAVCAAFAGSAFAPVLYRPEFDAVWRTSRGHVRSSARSHRWQGNRAKLASARRRGGRSLHSFDGDRRHHPQIARWRQASSRRTGRHPCAGIGRL